MGKLPALADLELHGGTAPEGHLINAGSVNFCPVLRAVRRVSFRYSEMCNPLHVLARWSHISPDAQIVLDRSQRPILSIKGWGRGWLPAVLTARIGPWSKQSAVVAVDDSDVDSYLSAAAEISPSRRPDCTHVLWLGSKVSAGSFRRLLCCPQQPPLRLELDAANQGHLQQPHVLQWRSCLSPTAAFFNTLAGQSAPRLVSLALAACGNLTNRDAAMLAGACHALKDVKLLGASKLTDLALHSLAAGCRQLERLHLTHANVTQEGVVVALATLAALQQLEVGSVTPALREQLRLRVRQEMAAEHQRWATRYADVDGLRSIVWSRKVVERQ
jgi:hypothetical protein